MSCKALQLQDYFQLIDGKVEQKKTAAGQYTDYVYNDFGQLESIVSRFSKKNSVDRKIKYTYDEFDRLTSVDYGNGEKKIFVYDSWGKLIKSVATKGDTRRALVNKYDEFDRVVKSIESVFEKGKAQSAVKRTYAYSPYGKRTRLTVTTYGLKGGKMVKQDVIKTKWKFNKFGQLAKIEKGNDLVEYLYDRHGRVLKRTANAMNTYYTYTPLGQLETKSLGAPFDSDKKTAIATLKYIYATDGSINARIVNGVKQSYKYDQLGQLTAVLGANGKAVEQYTYDNAGNILKKDIGGKVTTYTYDKANQLVSSTSNGKTTNYEYDAAGRMVKEGTKSYAYGWLDKVMSVRRTANVPLQANGSGKDKLINTYTYSMNGQIASANIKGKTENFVWDGLALLKRGTTEYVYEPAVTGGNPILSNGKTLFNDMLGTTLGKYDGKKFIDNQRTSFGSGSESGFFTGKPHVSGLGYAFLFRNYRSDLGKWQSADPLGYPDGWNNLAYLNNKVINDIDFLGAWSFSKWLYTGDGNASDQTYNAAVQAAGAAYYDQLNAAIAGMPELGTALNYYGQTNSLVTWDASTALAQRVSADPLVGTFASSFKSNLQSKIENIIKAGGSASETSPLLTLDTGTTFDLGSALIMGQFYVNATASWTVTHISGNKYRYSGTINYSIDDTFDFSTGVHILSFGLLSLGKSFNVNVNWQSIIGGTFYE